MGSAPASGVSRSAGRALAENIGRVEVSETAVPSHTQEAGREARPATPGTGVLPNFGVRVYSAQSFWNSFCSIIFTLSFVP